MRINQFKFAKRATQRLQTHNQKGQNAKDILKKKKDNKTNDINKSKANKRKSKQGFLLFSVYELRRKKSK